MQDTSTLATAYSFIPIAHGKASVFIWKICTSCQNSEVILIFLQIMCIIHFKCVCVCLFVCVRVCVCACVCVCGCVRVQIYPAEGQCSCINQREALLGRLWHLSCVNSHFLFLHTHTHT